MKKRILTMFLAFTLVVGIPMFSFAETKTLNTPHGTLTATLSATGGLINNHGFKGTTKLSNTASKLYVKVAVVDYLTGNEEDSDYNTDTSTKSVSITVYGNDKNRKKTGYGTHELRDSTSYPLYTTETKG